MGDPGGVGPEILLRVLSDAEVRSKTVPLVFGDPALLIRLGSRYGWDVDFEIEPTGIIEPDKFVIGRYNQRNAESSIACLHTAADAMERGRVDALVTGPIHKLALKSCKEAGPGHTEWLTKRFKADDSVMLLSGPQLKVVLATTHLALRKVDGSIRQSSLIKTVRLAHRELRRYFFPQGPRLALAALNPHGEESGDVGREEREILIPAVARLREYGLDVEGPISGDTVFHQAISGRYDAVVAMYHDQGMGPIKTMYFNEIVNVTLGLSVIRTSPGHGVAYDLAHQAKADPRSFKNAVLMAAAMAKADIRRDQPFRQDCSS